MSSLAALIPHQGGMCLLETVVTHDEQSISLTTTTHRSPDNPLRVDGRLRAVHLCEYGAQAMAVHGALQAQAKGLQAPPGMLVALRAVSFTRDYVEDLPGELQVTAECLQSTPSSQQYRFLIAHQGTVIAEGRAAVVLGQNPGLSIQRGGE
jgi:predicted hotdog family 3-hydroxylacyl-ACP dehydratase